MTNRPTGPAYGITTAMLVYLLPGTTLLGYWVACQVSGRPFAAVDWWHLKAPSRALLGCPVIVLRRLALRF